MTVTVAVRLFVALFGDPFRPLFCNLRECGEVSVARNQLRRNFPRPGGVWGGWMGWVGWGGVGWGRVVGWGGVE